MQDIFHNKVSPQDEVYSGGVMSGRPPTKKAPDFGQRLAVARRGRGLTQQQFADLLAMTVKAVDYYERRARNPSIEFVRRAADKLNISVVELLGENSVSVRQRPGPAPKLQRQIERDAA